METSNILTFNNKIESAAKSKCKIIPDKGVQIIKLDQLKIIIEKRQLSSEFNSTKLLYNDNVLVIQGLNSY